MKKRDISDSIRNTLLGKEYSYNELWDQVRKRTKCSIATFDKHLKKLVKQKLVERTPQKDSQNVMYKTNQDSIDKILDLRIESYKESLEKYCRDFELLITAYEQAPKIDDFKKNSSFHHKLASGIIEMYHHVTILSFLNTSGILHQLKPRFNVMYQNYLQSLETEMNRLRTADPDLHKKICALTLERLKFNSEQK